MSTVDSLKSGALNVSDIESLERMDPEQFVNDLLPHYPVQFLDHQMGDKWEVGLAKHRDNGDFQRCLMLTSEGGHLTTIAVMAFVRFQPGRSSADLDEMTSGAGYSLYQTPDGWRIKSLDEKRVSLKSEVLKKRGWLF